MLLLATAAAGQAKKMQGMVRWINRPWSLRIICRRFTEQSGESTNTRQKQVKAVLKYVMHASVFRNVHPIVAYKAEIDFSDEGSIKMLDAYARVFR